MQRLRDEAAEDRKAAAADREAAQHARDETVWSLREKQALEKIITAREQKLCELNEAALLARARELDDKQKRIEELTALYDKDRHAAMRVLTAA
jgi:hypothetical protein